MKWYYIPHLFHALWWTIVAFTAVYLFFSEEGMDWRIDLITAILFAPFIGVAVLVYRVMFRQKAPRDSSPLTPIAPTFDPVQSARNQSR